MSGISSNGGSGAAGGGWIIGSLNQKSKRRTCTEACYSPLNEQNYDGEATWSGVVCK